MLSESRFSGVFSSQPQQLENQALWCGEHAVVLPTLGMIVPNWFLVVPKYHTLNFAQQADAPRKELSNLVTSIFDAVADRGDELLIFEHGAQSAGSTVGCGLDHAHLHVIVATPAFLNVVWSAMEKDLSVKPTETAIDGLYRTIEPDQSYYLAWRRGRRLCEQPVREEVSQRFRRIVAAAAGLTEKWDYRRHLFHENIANTIANVRRRIPIAA